jgi:hypothetical protein
MDVCILCLYVVLSCEGRGLCDGLITRPEESYRVSNSVWLRNLKGGGQGAIWAVKPFHGCMKKNKYKVYRYWTIENGYKYERERNLCYYTVNQIIIRREKDKYESRKYEAYVGWRWAYGDWKGWEGILNKICALYVGRMKDGVTSCDVKEQKIWGTNC